MKSNPNTCGPVIAGERVKVINSRNLGLNGYTFPVVEGDNGNGRITVETEINVRYVLGHEEYQKLR